MWFYYPAMTNGSHKRNKTFKMIGLVVRCFFSWFIRLAAILVCLHADSGRDVLPSRSTQVLFSELISAGSYLQFPGGCGRWKTAKTKTKKDIIHHFCSIHLFKILVFLEFKIAGLDFEVFFCRLLQQILSCKFSNNVPKTDNTSLHSKYFYIWSYSIISLFTVFIYCL